MRTQVSQETLGNMDVYAKWAIIYTRLLGSDMWVNGRTI